MPGAPHRNTGRTVARPSSSSGTWAGFTATAACTGGSAPVLRMWGPAPPGAHRTRADRPPWSPPEPRPRTTFCRRRAEETSPREPRPAEGAGGRRRSDVPRESAGADVEALPGPVTTSPERAFPPTSPGKATSVVLHDSNTRRIDSFERLFALPCAPWQATTRVTPREGLSAPDGKRNPLGRVRGRDSGRPRRGHAGDGTGRGSRTGKRRRTRRVVAAAAAGRGRFRPPSDGSSVGTGGAPAFAVARHAPRARHRPGATTRRKTTSEVILLIPAMRAAPSGPRTYLPPRAEAEGS